MRARTHSALLAALCALACAPAPGDDDAGVRSEDAASTVVDARVDAALPPRPDAGSDAPDPACATPGCIRRLQVVGDFDLVALAPYLEPGVTLQSGYTIVLLEYVTGDATSLATVALPYPSTPPPTGYAIVAHAHGTVGVEDACTLSGTVFGSGLAGLFGGRGMIGVATDYPGLGTEGVHPYLVAEVEGAAVLDSLRAAAQLARLRSTPISGRYGVAGLSQGGHAALAAARMHLGYAPELDLRAVGVAAPANLWLEQWRGGVEVDGPHIALHAMLAYAWADHYGHAGPAIFRSDEIDRDMATTCAWDLGGTRDTLSSRIGESAAAIFTPEFLGAYRSGDFGDDFAVFTRGFEVNRVGPFASSAPIAIWQGDADETVLPWMTDALVDALRAGGMTIDYRVVPEGTHTDVAFGFVAQAQRRTDESLAWMRARLDE